MDFKPHYIEAKNLPDLWFRAVYDILDKGKIFTIDKGSYEGQKRLEYDYFIGHVNYPFFGSGTNDILPQIPSHFGIPNPVDFEYVYGGKNYSRSYIEYLMTPHKEPNESYTYGERLTKIPLDNYTHLLNEKDISELEKKVNGISIFEEDSKLYINQIEYVIENYKKFGHRNNQLVLQIAQPSDLLLKDPPCLRHIDTRIQDNKLHFFIYFRSWDLWSGMPANLAAIEFLQKYMASSIGVEQGSFIVESKGLHLYDYVIELAQLRTGLKKEFK